MKGIIHSIDTFGSVDGPGVRFIIFTKGCKLRCQYCHNVDTWSMENGEEKETDELLKQALRYRSYWGKEGGITVSGGEPLLQIDFLLELFTKAKKEGVHTCIDTAGQPFTREQPFFGKLEQLMEVTDLLLVDIKEYNSEKHRVLTGHSNGNILDFLRYLSEIHKPVWIRHVLVPGLTDEEEDLRKIREFMDTLTNVERVEVLPYHSMGEYKWEALGIPYPLKGVNPPDKESVQKAKEILGAC